MESGTYYYHTYDCRQIIAIHLFNEDLDTAEIKTYPFQRKQKYFMKTEAPLKSEIIKTPPFNLHT